MGFYRSTTRIRTASEADIPLLLSLINLAGSGLPLAAWRLAAVRGEDPWMAGRRQMLDPSSDIYFGYARLAETADGPVGMILAYALPKPIPRSSSQVPCFWEPIVSLEEEAAGSLHIAFLATHPEWHGRGIGSHLLAACGARRRDCEMSVIVSETNTRARALYRRFGYQDRSRRLFIDEFGRVRGDHWILMRKPEGAA